MFYVSTVLRIRPRKPLKVNVETRRISNVVKTEVAEQSIANIKTDPPLVHSPINSTGKSYSIEYLCVRCQYYFTTANFINLEQTTFYFIFQAIIFTEDAKKATPA